MGVKMGRRFAFVVLAIIWSGTWAANPQTLDQQEKCAAQARKTYQEDTYKERVESQRLGVPEQFRVIIRATTTPSSIGAL